MFFFDTCNAVPACEVRKPEYWRLGRRHLGLSLTLWRRNIKLKVLPSVNATWIDYFRLSNDFSGFEKRLISWCASFVIVAMSVEFNKDFSLSPNIISSNMAKIYVIWISWDWFHTTNCTTILSKSKSLVHLHQYEFQYLIIFNLKYTSKWNLNGKPLLLANK